MSSYVTTSLNDRVAYDRRGDGPAIVFVAGAGSWREIDATTTRTAELLAQEGFTTVVHDRVGRGESRVQGPIPLDRELAAIAALVDAVGGSAVLCGHSSGGAIALACAARGLPVTGLALWEVPLGATGSTGLGLADELRVLLAAGERDRALSLFLHGLPPELVERARSVPSMVEQAASLQPDADAFAWAESAPLAEVLAPVRVPVLVMVGETGYDDVMVPAAEAIVAAVPGARWTRVPGAEHSWEPVAMAAGLAAFVEETRADR